MVNFTIYNVRQVFSLSILIIQNVHRQIYFMNLSHGKVSRTFHIHLRSFTLQGHKETSQIRHQHFKKTYMVGGCPVAIIFTLYGLGVL